MVVRHKQEFFTGAKMFKEKILGTILDQKRPTTGVTSDDIAELEARQGVKLPMAYKQFLMECGRSAGLLFYDVSAFFPQTRELKEDVREMLEEEGVDFALTESAFFFSGYMADQYNYFICDGAQDPAVFHLDSRGTITQLAESFSAFVYDCIEESKEEFSRPEGKMVLDNW